MGSEINTKDSMYNVQTVASLKFSTELKSLEFTLQEELMQLDLQSLILLSDFLQLSISLMTLHIRLHYKLTVG